MIRDGGGYRGSRKAGTSCDCWTISQRAVLHQGMVVVANERVRIKRRQAMDGRRSSHGHGQWRNSHVVRIHFRMALWTISGDRSSPQFPCGTSDEHDVITGWVQCPVVALAWIIIRPGNLYKTFVEGEVVPDGILPALLVLPIVREVFHDVVVNATEGELSLWAGADSHHNQSVVRKWRLLVLGFLLSRLSIVCLLFVALISRTPGVSIAGREGLL